MTNKPPSKPDEGSEKEFDGDKDRDGGSSNTLHIETYNAAPNDLEQLRKIAETDPVLARHIVDQKDKEHARETGSERLGIVVTATLLALVLLIVLLLILNGGFWTLLAGTGVIIALAVLVRVVITGEWSDASWIGKMVAAITRAAGGRSQRDTENPGDE